MFEYVITVQLSKEHVAFRLQTHLFVPTKKHASFNLVWSMPPLKC